MKNILAWFHFVHKTQLLSGVNTIKMADAYTYIVYYIALVIP